MEPSSIQSATLLDIIFENRNKDYGAYQLRKQYDNRLTIAFLCMLAISIVLCFLFTLNRVSPVASIIQLFPKEHALQPPPEIQKPVIPLPAAAALTHNISNNNHPPVITSEPLKSNIDINPPDIGIKGSPDGNPNIQSVGPLKGDSTTHLPEIKTPEIRPEGPVNNPDVMPEFPGGTAALIKFLQQNLKSPSDLEEGEKKQVLVKFVVDQNGKLTSFNLIRSGGDEFDNEVFRVLKKMPLWKPGKSHNNNVSVYFSLPVTFTSAL